MNSKISPWLPAELDSLTALCARADRADWRVTPPWLASLRLPPPGASATMSEVLGDEYTEAGRAKLLAAAQAHPIYRRLIAEVPLAVAIPAASPFDILRRVCVIADRMATLIPRKEPKTSIRLDKRREAELKAVRRLQQLTGSPVLQRTLGERARELQRPSLVAWGKLAHPALWWLAFDLWTHANTANAQLLLQAAPLVDSADCDDSTAARYIKQAQRIVPRLSLPAPSQPVAPTPGFGGLLQGLMGAPSNPDT
jgi:hypothetical protein